MNQNPFSLYDFLGYLIPGGLFLYVLYFCGITLDWDVIIQLKKAAIAQESTLSLLGYSSIVILAYIIGHAIAICSAFLVEKYMNDTLQYPSIYLFWELNNEFKDEVKKGWGRKLKYFIIKTILCPIWLLDIITFNKLYSRELTKELATPLWDKLTNSYLKIFSVDLNQLKTSYALQGDLFRLAYHYSYEYSSNHQPKIQNYVALYGFCRNVCLVFLIFFWVALCTLIINLMSANTSHFNLIATLVMLLMTYIFYCGFVKFYRRFSLEVFMAFSVLKIN
ncbi:hypothetical protein [Enterobacter bugandensis]|uniref:hypothetical protein n=1 Tax=Enterobacter bugandensis TaxID=881260 RepID=UPI000C1E62EB|nr:hypothetical protein [Enterobacter bugandensis]PJD09514.1 hypothetical protein B9Q19_02935 [Enterobacter bugandensis]HDR2693204.1 hypothetical protein [Enterobacter bugandensis]HDS3779416.1 hypothetical protein [Enterobacter bugandensis]